jgi:hypothetical protein
VSNPAEDLPHDLRFLLLDLETRRPAADIAADVTIAERSGRQCAHRARPGSMATAAPYPFEQLGPLVLGNDALHLK